MSCSDYSFGYGSSGCMDYARGDELADHLSRERRRPRAQIFHDETNGQLTAEGHEIGPRSRNCWCGPYIEPYKNGIGIVHDYCFVSLNAS